MINSLSKFASFLLVLSQVGPALAAETKPTAPAAAAIGGTFVNPFQKVDVQDLSTVGGADFGVLTDESGGLGADLWQGSDRLVVEAVLPRLPVPTNSPAATDLARRLILTRAQPPEGPTRGVSLFTARLDRVFELGQVGLIEPLIAQMPAESGVPAVAAIRSDALFLQGLDQEACAIAAAMKGRASDALWTKRIAFCDALGGDVVAARIGTDILTEMGDADEAFRVLMARLVDKSKAQPKEASSPQAVHFALLRAAQGTLPDASILRMGPAVAVAFAAWEGAPPSQRALAGEVAVGSGAMSAGGLKQLYEAIPIAEKVLKAQLDTTKLSLGTAGTAELLRRLSTAQTDSERAPLIYQALHGARLRGAFAAASEVLATELTALVPSPEFLPFAAEFGAAQVMAGDRSIARRWLALMRQAGADRTEAGEALRSILSIAGESDFEWTAEAATERARNSRGPAAKSRAALEYSLNAALTDLAAEAALLELLAAPFKGDRAAANPALVESLIRAGYGKARGEAAILALAVLGSEGPVGASDQDVVAAVRALRQVGLVADARQIAAEALIARLP